MVERGRGKIVFTASLLSFQGGINVRGYTAAKSGLAGLVRALSNEWAPHGVNVNAIAPGYIATDNTQALRDDAQRYQAILDRIPAGRWGEPDDLGGRDGLPRLGGLGLRQRHRAPGRRRMARPMTATVLDALVAACRCRLIPVATIADPADAAPLAAALAARRRRGDRGDVPHRRPRRRVDRGPRRLGASSSAPARFGRPTQLDEALAAGAQFVVSPALDAAVVERCLRRGRAGPARDRDRRPS